MQTALAIGGLIAFNYVFSAANKTEADQPSREISFQTFKRDYLEPGLVDKIVVSNRSTAKVYTFKEAPMGHNDAAAIEDSTAQPSSQSRCAVHHARTISPRRPGRWPDSQATRFHSRERAGMRCRLACALIAFFSVVPVYVAACQVHVLVQHRLRGQLRAEAGRHPRRARHQPARQCV